nr:ORF2 [Torque teno felis virus]QYD02243.1 ORF2 [Torque teno felis virus]
MQPPAPSPSLMLPVIDLSGPPDLDHNIHYKQREARWKRLVSTSHAEWCCCGSYLNHFLPRDSKLRSCTDTEEEKHGEADVEGITGAEADASGGVGENTDVGDDAIIEQ